MADHPHPPRIAVWLLTRLWPSTNLDLLLGDLQEAYAYRWHATAPWRAWCWYWGQVVRGVPAFFLQSFLWSIIMLQSYLTSTLRHIQRYKGYAFLNIAGLALGLACGFLILFFVQTERSYDRFHVHADSIYRLLNEYDVRGTTRISGGMPPPLAATLVSDIPEVEDAVRLWKRDNVLITRDAAERLSDYEDGFLYADSTFFSFFSFSLIQGDPTQVLAQPRTLVLTASAADKYFGTTDPIGQTLTLTMRGETYPFTVSGVMADLPTTSSIQFRFVTSFASAETIANEKFLLDFGWRAAPYPTYIRLQEGASPNAVEAKLSDTIRRYVGEERITSSTYFLEPLTDIYLHGRTVNALGLQGNRSYVFIFASIAFGILLIAGINYMTLATARSERRAREVGVRKVVGARRSQLAWQFLGESILFSVCAALLAVGLIYYSMPFFSALVGKAIASHALLSLSSIAVLGGLVLLLGILAGVYPALLLSHFKPNDVLKGTFTMGKQSSLLRKTLVTLQFALSAVLIVSTFIIYHQLRYMQGKELGYSHEHVVTMYLWDTPLHTQAEAFKQALHQLTVVEQVALSTTIPTKNIPRVQMDGMAEQPAVPALTLGVDADFLETFDLTLAKGRNFSAAVSAVRTPIILNETLVQTLGLGNPIGTTLSVRNKERTVVGVIEDFHLLSLHSTIEPMMLMPTTRPNYVSVRLHPGDLKHALAQIEAVWATFAPAYPFTFTFLDEAVAQLYKAEERLAEIFYLFAFIAVGIACLGLLGLAAYTAERRTREISIRKVFGASAWRIAYLLVGDFLKLTLVAFLIAVPVAYYGVESWLQNFAYRTDPSLVVFMAAGGLLLLLTLITVVYQIYRAAQTNPAQALQRD